jgi:hypothetical protein
LGVVDNHFLEDISLRVTLCTFKSEMFTGTFWIVYNALFSYSRTYEDVLFHAFSDLNVLTRVFHQHLGKPTLKLLFPKNIRSIDFEKERCTQFSVCTGFAKDWIVNHVIP